MSEFYNKVKDYLLDLAYEIISENEKDELFIISKEEDGISNVIIDCEDSLLIIE